MLWFLVFFLVWNHQSNCGVAVCVLCLVLVMPCSGLRFMTVVWSLTVRTYLVLVYTSKLQVCIGEELLLDILLL